MLHFLSFMWNPLSWVMEAAAVVAIAVDKYVLREGGEGPTAARLWGEHGCVACLGGGGTARRGGVPECHGGSSSAGRGVRTVCAGERRPCAAADASLVGLASCVVSFCRSPPCLCAFLVLALLLRDLCSGGGEPPDYEDFAGIVFLLLLNATIGYVEDARAGNAVAALAASLATQATALRDGGWATLPAAELVPGDIVHVKLGDVCPADVRVLGDAAAGLDDAPLGGDDGDEDATGGPLPPPLPPVALKVDQAGLTGESLPVDKRVGALAYAGSVVKSGESPAVVVATGGQTFFGKAAGLVAAASADGATASTTLTSIGTFCVVAIAVALTVEVAVMYAALGYSYRRGVSNALVLLIGGVPIAMPTVLSVTSALGARQLAAKGAVVTSIAAVEALAAVDVLVSDKTGTLTTGVLTIDTENVAILDGARGGGGAGGVDVDGVVLLAARASRTENADAIDTAVVGCLPSPAAARAGITETRFVPFDPSNKRTAITYTDDASGETVEVTKGAPHTILDVTQADAATHEAVDRIVAGFARRGLRSLGLASRTLPSGAAATAAVTAAPWTYVAVIPIFDPPRHDTVDTVRRVRAAGVDVKMATGDQREIAVETCARLGMGTNVLPAEALVTTAAAAAAGGGLFVGSLIDVIEGADGFAGVFPQSKYLIVEELQRAGHTVAMTVRCWVGTWGRGGGGCVCAERGSASIYRRLDAVRRACRAFVLMCSSCSPSDCCFLYGCGACVCALSVP